MSKRYETAYYNYTLNDELTKHPLYTKGDIAYIDIIDTHNNNTVVARFNVKLNTSGLRIELYKSNRSIQSVTKQTKFAELLCEQMNRESGY
jgi:hypothetical protein